MKPVLLICLFLSLVVLSACDVNTSPPAPNAAPTDLPLITIVPTPSKPNTATVTGYLLEKPQSPQPAAGAILYLASLVNGADGKPALASLDRASPLRTQSDREGRFVFVDVPPQKYTLILDRITVAYMLNSPKDNSDMFIEPQSNQVLDLGKLTYPSLPQFGR